MDSWPKLLGCDDSQWPTSPNTKEGKAEIESCTVNLIDNVKTQINYDLKSLFEVERYNSLRKLIRATYYVLKSNHLLKAEVNKCNQSFSYDIQKGDFDNAKLIWIKNEQKLFFDNPKRLKELDCALNLFYDDQGILRLKGRLQNTNKKFDEKYPIFLDKDSYFTNLVILDCHNRVGHCRMKDTWNQMRSKYWVTQGRRTVNRVIQKCTKCS